MPQPVFNSASAKPSANPSVGFMIFTVPSNKANAMPVGRLRRSKSSLFWLFSLIFVGLPFLVFGGRHVVGKGFGFVEINWKTDGGFGLQRL